MNKRVGFFEEAMESGVSLTKKSGKTVAKSASDTTKAVASQLGVPASSDQGNDGFIEGLYGSSDPKKQNQASQSPQANDDVAKNPPKTPEEAASQAEDKRKLAELKAKLHDEVYYQPLINPKRGQQEERPVEKIEREKEEEMQDLQKKEEKKPPVLVQRNQQRVEKFPGGGG